MTSLWLGIWFLFANTSIAPEKQPCHNIPRYSTIRDEYPSVTVHQSTLLTFSKPFSVPHCLQVKSPNLGTGNLHELQPADVSVTAFLHSVCVLDVEWGVEPAHSMLPPPQIRIC